METNYAVQSVSGAPTASIVTGTSTSQQQAPPPPQSTNTPQQQSNIPPPPPGYSASDVIASAPAVSSAPPPPPGYSASDIIASSTQPTDNQQAQDNTQAQPDAGNYITADTDHSLVGTAQQIGSVGAGIGEGLLHTLNIVDSMAGVGSSQGADTWGARLNARMHAILQSRENELAQGNSQNPVERDLGYGMENLMEFVGGDEALQGLSVAERLGKMGSIAKAIEAHPILAKIVGAGMSALRMGAVGTGQGLAHGETLGTSATQGAVAGVTGGAMEGAGDVLFPKVAD
jgi:hypothetical protein